MAVRRELRDREHPVYIGKPDPLRFAVRQIIPTYIAGIGWIGMLVVYVMPDFLSEDPSILGIIVFALFFLIGLGILASPLWLYQRGLRTIYVVTNRRLLVLNGWLKPSVIDYEPTVLNYIERKERSDGSGTVYFLRETGASGAPEKRGFLFVPDAQEAERCIVALKRGDSHGTGRRLDPALFPGG